MNIYLIGMMIAMIVFMIIGFVVSKKVKTAEDFYVAGRQAPVILIAGSLIASYSSTGLFMGDAATCYDGALAPILTFAGMQSAGYIIGAVFFGRYLRRSRAMTIPEFFGQRFVSPAMRMLSAVVAMVTMTVYLLSVMQGTGTLMAVVTGVSYKVCIFIAMVVFTFISVVSGSKGVLITDTLMAGIFTAALLVGVACIAGNCGGWYQAIISLAANPNTSAILSWKGRPGVLGPLYTTGADSIIWGLTYGVVWTSVCMIGPWQASRYQMASSEHVIVKSSYISAIGVFILEFTAAMGAVMVNVVYPDMEDSSHVLIWAAMNLMPTLLGVVLLTGILAAGISSATTFLSLIGASMANDVMPALQRIRRKGKADIDQQKLDRTSIRSGRYAMLLVAVIVLAVAETNPQALFVIMLLGGSIVASSWMPVAVAAVFSRRVTKAGAFSGMLSGFVGCFVVKLFVTLAGITLPSYLDPVIIGIVLNILVMTAVSAFTQVTDAEKQARAAMFIMPESEKKPIEVRKTMAVSKIAIGIGALFTVGILAAWVVPYLIGSGL